MPYTLLKKKLKKESGFTLIELMVVIAIIGIMSAISLTGLFSPEHKIKKVARKLYGDIQKTRIAAIKTNQNWAIIFSPGAASYQICSDDGDGDWTTPADNTIEETVLFSDIGAGVQYGHSPATSPLVDADIPTFDNEVSYTSDMVVFNSRGTSEYDGYVYLEYAGIAYAVGSLKTGVTRLKRWSNGNWR